MPSVAHLSYEERESTPTRWIIIFVVLSLLAHALIILALLLISHYEPKPKLDAPVETKPPVTLSLVPPPPQQKQQPRPFIPTSPQKNVPHKDELVESDNDVRLTSHSKTNRKPDSVMPDVVSKNEHPANLQTSPNVQTKPKAQMPSPPTPKQQEAKPQDQTPPQPQQPPQPKPSPQPAKPTPQPPKPEPPKPPTPQPTKPDVDPLTGLPVLPPLSAPTLAPQTQVTKQTSSSATPPPSIPDVAANVQGRAGMSGSPSPDAMATELGRYKAKVYRAVGARWYKKVADQLQVLPVGMVHIQYTIYSDGTVETKLLEGGNLQILYAISQNSITEAAPFDPFSPALLKELNGATSYTDDFSFSVY